jgi:Cu/Ag efflux pump CusA
MVYHSAKEATHVLLAIPFALTGGFFLQYLLGYRFSVAIWVGYIVLSGVAIPILWSHEVGSEIMRPIAVPLVGGMVSSAVHILIVTPVLFAQLRRRSSSTGLQGA